MHTDIVIKDPTACTQMQVYPFKLYCNHWPCDAEFFFNNTPRFSKWNEQKCIMLAALIKILHDLTITLHYYITLR